MYIYLLLAARQVHVVYLYQLLGAAHYMHFISNHDKIIRHYYIGNYGISVYSTLLGILLTMWIDLKIY